MDNNAFAVYQKYFLTGHYVILLGHVQDLLKCYVFNINVLIETCWYKKKKKKKLSFASFIGQRKISYVLLDIFPILLVEYMIFCKFFHKINLIKNCNKLKSL